ncbi:TlpA disulfide reductase family protein [Spirosoma sp. KNUC1025]|uniref:TlpA disulfide reductase family protein n=1 Tax=Spirosoma sp. KNUC1025 TaxID=2894082 RepID=UPI00386F5EDC|nr:AhpC/TSA family protein [Spirosoma sp. KNUC1025]
MKNYFAIVLLLIPTVLWAQGGSYTIDGKLAGIKSPTKAYVRYRIGSDIHADSAQIQNGAFSIKGTIEEPKQVALFVDKSYALIYLEPGTITVNSADVLENATIGGTPLNVDYQKLKTMLKSSTDKMAQLMKDYQSATDVQKKSKAFEESIDKRNEAIQAEQKKIKAQFIQENPNTVVSLDVLQQYDYTPDYAEVSPLFDGLSGAVKNSKSGKEYAKMLAGIKATSIGSISPEFTQTDTAGRAVALSSFRGKYVLIDFWASWCGPCRVENPNVVKNFQQYKDKNFTVLGVSLDRPNAKEAWMKAIHKDGLDWTHVSDLKFWDNEVAKQYAVRSIPQNFLLSPDGKIVAKDIRGEALGKKLEELLTAKP